MYQAYEEGRRYASLPRVGNSAKLVLNHGKTES